MPCMFSYHLNQIKKNSKLCVIYDSDFVTWSADKVIDNIFSSTEIKNYYSSIILPKVNRILIVVCETPSDVAYKRWSQRENKVLSLKEKGKWIEKRMVWKKAREKVFLVLSKLPNIRIVKLNGIEDPKKNSTYISKILLSKEYLN